MDSFKTQVVYLAEAFIPELREDLGLKKDFIESFLFFFKDLDEDAAGKLKLLPKVLNILSVLNSFKTLKNHTPETRERVLQKLSHFPVSKIVAGLTGIRSLIFVSYYSMPQVWGRLNYDGPIVKRP